MVKSKLKHNLGLQLDLHAAFCVTPLPDWLITIESQERYAFLKEWELSSRSTLDLETAEGKEGNGLDPYRGHIRLFQILLPSGKLLIVDRFQKDRDPIFFRTFLETLKKVLLNPNHLIIGHNLYFDLLWLRVKYGFYAKGVRDTKILGQILRSGIKSQRYSLSAVHSWLFNEGLCKELQTSNWNNPHLSNDQLIYAATDVIATENCYLELCKRIKKYQDTLDINGEPCRRSLIEVATIECDCIPAFVEIGCQGYPIDLEVVNQLIADYEFAILDIYAPVQARLHNLSYSAFALDLASAIYDIHGIWLIQEKSAYELSKLDGDDDADLVKPKQLSLFGKQYPVIPKTHVLTTNSSNLFAYYLDTKNEDLLVLSLVRSLKKLKDTLVNLRDSAIQNRGRAKSRYNTLGNTGSGRSTSSGDNKSTTIALNLQNLPNAVEHPLLDKYNLKPIRYCIQPEAGKKLSIQDLSSSHSRICAALSGDRTLIESLDAKDPHL